MHVPHAGPDGDLGTSADAGILLQIRGTGDLKVYAKQVGFEFGAACDGCLHVLAAADLGLEDGPANRGRRQGTNYAEPAVARARDLPQLKKLLCGPRMTVKKRDVIREEVRTLAMPCIRSERTSIEMQVVSGVVAVDVRVFENVGLRAQYAEMANGVADYRGVSITEDVSKLVPSVGGVE